MGYRIERLSDENLAQLVVLYEECFGLTVQVQFLQAKYSTENFGAKYIGYIAYEENSTVAAAYYGVFPLICLVRGDEVLAAQSGDTMTHPRHQGRGLFVTPANATYVLARQEGIKFVFGFPNKNSYHGFVNKLGVEALLRYYQLQDKNKYVPVR